MSKPESAEDLSNLTLAAASGADDADALTQLPLRDRLDTPAFWRQPAVRADLHALLQRELAASHQNTRAPVVEALPPPAPPARRASRTGFLGSLMPVRSREAPRVVEAPRRELVLGPRVSVGEEEVCWRRENEFGIWETDTRIGVVVRVWTE
jgi:hypothetical protein